MILEFTTKLIEALNLGAALTSNSGSAISLGVYMKAIGFDTSRVERGRRPRKKAAALLLQTRRLQSYPHAFMVGGESWLYVKFMLLIMV